MGNPPQGYSTEQDALAIGQTLDGKYKILNLLGMGGMGIVYLAENLSIGRPVAIKILRSRARRDAATLTRFRQEARASAAIGHPGIVDVLDMGETETGQGYIVMERLEGESLAARLKQRGRLAVTEALCVVTEALDAITAAHAKGIVHRDLKPDNLFLVWKPKWCVKILDFGISRIENDEDDMRLTGSNMVMGSVLYMPPEQARDARAAGPQADLYALGAVLYHALAGRPPFVGQNYSEVLSKVLTDPHEPITKFAPDVEPPLATLIDELLAKDPARRPPGAREVRAALLAMAKEPLRPPAAPSAAVGYATTLPPGLVSAKDVPLGDTLAATAPAPLPLGDTVAETVAPDTPAAAFDSAPTLGELASRTQPPTRRSRAWIVGGALAAVAAAGAVVWIARSGGHDTPPPADAAPPHVTPNAASPPAVTPDAAEVVIDGAILPGPSDAAVIDAAPRVAAGRDAGTLKRPDAAVAPPDAAGPADAVGRDGFVEFVPTPGQP